MASSSEDRREEGAEQMVHKTKVIQFLGRTTPIVLQNDNGPCPLLAICNVLLLKNNMNLSPDIPEVSQEKLLSLVAERLLDSNSNTNNKDNEFAENQQQNISDAIDLLPRLTTGIDVNIKFRRIDDFEFTSECAIFDLLDIPLYHGWIVDPEDLDTANAIGSKSYNTIMGELVSLETNNVQSEYKQNPEDQCVDFAAATTATLGVPSPCLSRAKSFDDSPRSISNDHALRKGDLEEEADLIKALKLSESNDVNADNLYNDTDQSESLKKSVEKDMDNDVVPFEANSLTSKKDDGNSTGLSIPNIVKEPNADKAIETEVAIFDLSGSVTQTQNLVGDEHGQEQTKLPADFIESNDRGSNKALPDLIDLDDSKDNNSNNATPELTDHDEPENIKTNSATSDLTNLDKSEDNKSNDETSSDLADLDESKDKKSNDATPDLSNGKNVNVIEALTPVGGESEPLYEGEERIMESRTTPFVDGEPMYEGEVALAEQVEKNNNDGFDTCPKDEITLKQGELIRDFLSNSASQLTLYGLFRLQEGLKERELCVFFRNNHFSTMFKFDGELYLLATDQGYLSQSDLVWEKLNEVNGNTLFMTSNFKEFKVDESPTNNTTWDEQNAIADTTEYLASIDNSAKSQSNYTSDLELAIALQQQEYEQQQQVNNVDRPNVERPNVGRGSRLVTGPQRSSTTNQASSTPRQEAKQNKDKCIVM